MEKDTIDTALTRARASLDAVLAALATEGTGRQLPKQRPLLLLAWASRCKPAEA